MLNLRIFFCNRGLLWLCINFELLIFQRNFVSFYWHFHLNQLIVDYWFCKVAIIFIYTRRICGLQNQHHINTVFRMFVTNFIRYFFFSKFYLCKCILFFLICWYYWNQLFLFFSFLWLCIAQKNFQINLLSVCILLFFLRSVKLELFADVYFCILFFFLFTLLFYLFLPSIIWLYQKYLPVIFQKIITW